MPLRSYIDGGRLFGLLLLVAGSLHAQANRANVTEGFDKPLREIVVDIGAAPFYESSQHVRNKLTCFYYSAFVVKEYDQGEKGASWLSIRRSAQAACTRRHEEDERVYMSPEWSGYFRGVKGTVAFFDAPGRLVTKIGERRFVTSMIGNSQGRTEISLDLAE